MDSRFIHFGGDHFYPEKFQPIKNYETSFVKPHGGLWASPLSTNDWAEYCKYNMMNNKLWNGWFTFHLKDHSQVLQITNQKQLDDAYNEFRNYNRISHTSKADLYFFDYEKMQRYYDAMYVEIFGSIEGGIGRGTYWSLYGFDITTLLVFNPDIIIEDTD